MVDAITRMVESPWFWLGLAFGAVMGLAFLVGWIAGDGDG